MQSYYIIMPWIKLYNFSYPSQQIIELHNISKLFSGYENHFFSVHYSTIPTMQCVFLLQKSWILTNKWSQIILHQTPTAPDFFRCFDNLDVKKISSDQCNSMNSEQLYLRPQESEPSPNSLLMIRQVSHSDILITWLHQYFVISQCM